MDRLKILSMLVSFGIWVLAASTAHSQIKLVQAIPTKSFGFLPLLVAQEKGFYRAEGLEVANPIMKTPSAVAGLTSGEVHFVAADSSMRAAMQGAPVKAVVFYYDRPTMIFMVRPEIRSFEDLKGKNIAVHTYGSAEDLATREIMRAHGVADKDYANVPMGPEPQRILSMTKGLAHATLLNPDGAAMAETQVPGAKRLASFGDLQKTPFSGFAVGEKFLTGSPETVKKFLRASLRAMLLTRDQPQEAAAVAEKALGMDGKVALAAVRHVVAAISFKDPGGFTEVGMRAWIASNAKTLSRNPDEVKISDISDLRLLREVQQELGIRCEGGYGCSR